MGISITAAEHNLAQAFEQNAQIQADLSKALKDLSKNPDLALMQILMILGSESSGTMGLAENGVSQDAQKMNIMTALATYTTKIADDINTMSGPAGTVPGTRFVATIDLIHQCRALQGLLGKTSFTWTNPITKESVTTQWIDPSMAAKAQSSLTSFMNRLGITPSGASALSLEPSVWGKISGWINSPTTGSPTGQEQIQAMNKDLAVVSNLFQSLSTTAQNVVKEGNTTLTQYQSNQGTLFTDLIALNKAIVAHLGGN